MTVTDEKIVIHRTPQEVYDRVIDLQTQKTWERSIVSANPVDGSWEPRPGMEIDYVLKAGAMKMKARSRVIDLDAGHSGTYEMTGAMGTVRGSYVCEPHPDGTLFTHHVETQPSGVVRDTVARVITPMFRRQIRAGLENLRDELEQK
jgi:carbon monoxide dehydrogenase subunit G